MMGCAPTTRGVGASSRVSTSPLLWSLHDHVHPETDQGARPAAYEALAASCGDRLGPPAQCLLRDDNRHVRSAG